MAETRSRCKVCDSNQVADINLMLRNKETISKISKLYGIDRKTITKHRDQCAAGFLSEDEETGSIAGDALIKDVRTQIAMVKKMVAACDEWLTDPDDPSKYYIGPRGEDIEIMYGEVSQRTGREKPQSKKANLQEILNVIDQSGKFVIRGTKDNYADPRKLLLEAIGKLEGTVKMIHESTQKQIEWEHKRRVLSKAAEAAAKGGNVELTIEKQINTITERVTIALKESNTDELSRLAGLPIIE